MFKSEKWRNKQGKSGKNHHMYNKCHSEKTKRKISKSMGGGNKTSFNTKQIPWNKGVPRSEETKRKIRISVIQDLKNKYPKASPNYSVRAYNWFKLFDKINKTEGLYGPNEYFIEELGYWPDYINFDTKLIIEWDEKAHKYKKEKDFSRQEKIMKKFSDFEFIRIKDH